MSKKKKEKKYFSILSKQKPKKKKKFITLRSKLLFLGVIGLGVGGYLIYDHYHKPFFTYLSKITLFDKEQSKNTSNKERFPSFLVKPEPDQQFSDNLIHKVIEAANMKSKTTIPFEPSELAKHIQTQFRFARVHIVKTGEDRFVISIFKRKPLLKIEVANNQRFVTKNGVVFEDSTFENDESFPLIIGVLNSSAKQYKNSKDHSLIMTIEEQTTLNEAISLYETMNKNNFEISKIAFNNYRGFYVTLKENYTEVILGRKPFDRKLERLGKILKSQANMGKVSYRIELDYDGKAFIKDKKPITETTL